MDILRRLFYIYVILSLHRIVSLYILHRVVVFINIILEDVTMASVKKHRKAKIAKHKRKKRSRANRHKKK